MLKIYHSPGTRGFRVMWVCEELGVPYEIHPVDFSADYRRTPEWQAGALAMLDRQAWRNNRAGEVEW